VIRHPLADPGAEQPLEGFEAGAPAWMASSLNYCVRCGARLVLGSVPDDHRDRHSCASCGYIAYLNPRIVVTTIPVTQSGELVLLRRAIEPGLGLWAQPGGYLEADETAIQGARRETLEETGLVVEPTTIVGIYSRPQAAIVVVAYEARIVGGEMTTTPEALEVRVVAPDEIPWPEIAFNTTTWALRDWLSSRVVP
jgi:ADP-ribose pyrophosphatase YjhB (NUDIX family)